MLSCSQTKVVNETQKQQKSLYIQKQEEIIDMGNGWFNVTTSVFIENITPEEAKEKAISKACKMSIEYYSGVEVTGRSYLIQAESNEKILIDYFSQLTKQTSKGIILKKEILEERIETFGNSLQKVIILKVKVGKQKGEPDPYFKIVANLNKEYFKEGETLELSVIPSKDCYLTIFNITSDEHVLTIFPNKYRENNFVKSDSVFSLPNDYEKSIGLKYKLGLLPNKDEDTEIIKIIATKKPVNFIIDDSFRNAFVALQNWLVTIPRNEIEEVDLQYYIYK